MTTAPAPPRPAARPRPRRQPLGLRVLRWLGWLCIAAGALVLLYLVYSLLFTNLETGVAQSELEQRWDAAAAPADASADAPAPVEEGTEPGGSEGTAVVEEPSPDPRGADPGEAVAILEFRRPGSDEPLVRAEPLFVVGGVSVADLTRGPGHYPGTAAPGDVGNFAVAGHRTTYGAPFLHLDQLAEGDEVIVTDRDRQVWTYRVATQRIVSPADVTVLGPDPLETGGATLTLTTCHPRFSNRQRLIVFAELVEGPDGPVEGSSG